MISHGGRERGPIFFDTSVALWCVIVFFLDPLQTKTKTTKMLKFQKLTDILKNSMFLFFYTTNSRAFARWMTHFVFTLKGCVV